MTDKEEAPKKAYKSPWRDWDLFISHASEDKPFVRGVVEELSSLGLSVFLDERELIAGRSLRLQIERGLLNSHLAALFISRHFLAKRWPMEEYDALFTLEGGGKTKILPVLLGVNIDDVARVSPMLASRLAIFSDGNTKNTAASILSNVEKLYNEEGSWAQLVRIDTLCLPWVSRPRFLQKSLKILDDYFPKFWLPNKSLSDIPHDGDVKTVRVGDLIQAPTLCDGKIVVVTGHQQCLQLYESHENGFNEYVFQLRTIDPAFNKSLVYVRYVIHRSILENEDSEGSPRSSLILEKLPTAPPNYITNAIGVLIAYGAMRISDDSIQNCAYVVAIEVAHLPRII